MFTYSQYYAKSIREAFVFAAEVVNTNRLQNTRLLIKLAILLRMSHITENCVSQ